MDLGQHWFRLYLCEQGKMFCQLDAYKYSSMKLCTIYIYIYIYIYFKDMNLKMSSANWWSFCRVKYIKENTPETLVCMSGLTLHFAKVSTYQQFDCLFYKFFRPTAQESSKLCNIGPLHDDVIKMETFSALLAPCVGNSPVTGEFPTQRPVTRSFDAFFDRHLNKRLSKQS